MDEDSDSNPPETNVSKWLAREKNNVPLQLQPYWPTCGKLLRRVIDFKPEL